jgi:NarL family two-component system sensor histidine kinase LiaS
MRRFFIISLFLVALLSVIIWAISTFVQPILPEYINKNIFIFTAVLTSIIGAIAGLKNITELLNFLFSNKRKKSESTDFTINQEFQKMGLEDDLHELINWYHSGVVLYLDTLSDMLQKREYKAAKDIMPDILMRAHSTVNELRSIHINILSGIYEEVYFSNAIHTLISMWIQRTSPLNKGNLSIIPECPNNLQLPMTISTPLLKIINLALSNAIVHSGILNDSRISIHVFVNKTNNQILVKISDDGVGTEQLNRGYGISRIENIVRQLNSSGIISYLDINSKKGKGTSVSVQVALNEDIH